MPDTNSATAKPLAAEDPLKNTSPFQVGQILTLTTATKMMFPAVVENVDGDEITFTECREGKISTPSWPSETLVPFVRQMTREEAQAFLIGLLEMKSKLDRMIIALKEGA